MVTHGSRLQALVGSSDLSSHAMDQSAHALDSIGWYGLYNCTQLHSPEDMQVYPLPPANAKEVESMHKDGF